MKRKDLKGRDGQEENLGAKEKENKKGAMLDNERKLRR